VCVCVYVHKHLSTAQGKRDQWIIENNLAHLLEYTPGLKILHVPFALFDSFFGLARTPPPIARPCPRAMLTLTLPGPAELSAIWNPRIKPYPAHPKGIKRVAHVLSMCC
jgi:hypothetical protein